MEIHAGTEYNQTDSMIKRDRTSRAVVAFVSPPTALYAGYLLGETFSLWFKLPLILGDFLGLSIGGIIAIWMISRSFISNPAVTAFVSINPLVTLFPFLGSALRKYGPGFHFCYWWEKRSGGSTVDLSEAAETFNIAVQVSPGTVAIKYSVRLRPDITRLEEFLSGAASVASNLGGLISAAMVEYISSKSVTEAIQSLPDLNSNLASKFKHGAEQGETASDFEKRFGVIIGDVTAEEILTSSEVQETMNAVAEGEIINQIVLNSFGMKSSTDLQEAIAKGEISQRDVNFRRTQAHALSGNPLGMEIKEQNFNLNVTGLDKVSPDLLQVLATSLATVANKKGPAQESTPKSSKGGKAS